MTARLICVIGVAILAGCVDEPAPKEAEQAAAVIGQDAVDDLIKKDQLSIEEAAEKATKLIEQDARTQTEAEAAANDRQIEQ